MSELPYFQRSQGNTIPQQLNLVPIIPIQDNPYLSRSNTYSGTLPNFSTIPISYPVTSYNQSNIPINYPPSQNLIPQQIGIVPKVLNGEGNSSLQYQPINPIPLSLKNSFQPYYQTTNDLGTSNLIMLPMEKNNLLQGNLSNQIHFSNPLANQQNIVQYNIFPQAINSFNSGNQSFAPYGMNLANNVNNYNGQIIHRENIMNQYGQNKNNINTNSGLQNLSINNDRNTDEKCNRENKDIAPVPVVPVPIKKVQFECPVCHEEYSREQFFSERQKNFVVEYYCKSCGDTIDNDFYFQCKICKFKFCDKCTLLK